MNSILRKTSIICLHVPFRKCLAQNILQHSSGVSKFASVNFSSGLRSCSFTKPENITYQQVRYSVSGFFNKHTADDIWKSVSNVSSAGRRRGRGKIRGKKVIKDLNRGQTIGIGKSNYRFPGLSSPIIRGREIVERQKLPPDENYQENLVKLRQPMAKLKKQRVAPIDRGWSGGKADGRKIGPPDPIGEATFEGFETIILEQKPVFHMTRHMGRFRTVSTICGTGNGNGLFGYAMATAQESKAATKRSKNKAAQKLMFIPRYEERTIMHNFYSRFANTRVFAWKKSPGYGLCCHRLIKSICELIGIKDLAVKVEGGRSTLNVMNAFLLGLLRQKTYEELAAETNMHVVEMDPLHGYYPKVLASPDTPLPSAEEPLDFDLYCFDKNVYAEKKKLPPYYTKYRRWPIEVRKREKERNKSEARLQLINEYGELRSFLSDTFPECKAFLPPWSKVVKEKKSTENAETE